MNVWGRILKLAGWQVEITAPRRDKCVICVAPHTSNWDFILGILAYKSVGRKANFLMKAFWFFFPLKYLLTYLGGIPVIRKKSKDSPSLTASLIQRFRDSDYLNLAVTPEGTRSLQPEWRSGFLHIAIGAHVPVELGVIDYSMKKVIIRDEYIPSGDIREDMRQIKNYYRVFDRAAKFLEKFTI